MVGRIRSWSVIAMNVVAAVVFAGAIWAASVARAPAETASSVACSDTGSTRWTATTSSGDRVMLTLYRNGEAISGGFHVWLSSGQIVDRGFMRGLIRTTQVPGEMFFELEGNVFAPSPHQGYAHLWGVMRRGNGQGQVAIGGAFPTEVGIVTQSTCPRWPQEYYYDSSGRPGRLPAPPHTCSIGFVWRELHVWDKVCVSEDQREFAAQSNRAAASRVVPPDPRGFGTPPCRPNNWLRNGYPGDRACSDGLLEAVEFSRQNENRLYTTVNAADGPRGLPDYGACRTYAGLAMAAINDNRSRNCGDTGALWSGRENSLMAQCMQNMLTRGVSETLRLEQAAEAERKAVNARCVPRPINRREPTAPIPVPPPPPSVNLERSTSGRDLVVDRCPNGLVWRQARAEDRVCVSPAAHARTAEENRMADQRRNPGGAYGPNTCLAGFVWREAFPGDVVCVTPGARSVAGQENAGRR